MTASLKVRSAIVVRVGERYLEPSSPLQTAEAWHWERAIQPGRGVSIKRATQVPIWPERPESTQFPHKHKENRGTCKQITGDEGHPDGPGTRSSGGQAGR